MNTLIVSTFSCSFEVFERFVADFHEKEGHKYVKEYELIKVNDGKSHLILEVTDLEGFWCSDKFSRNERLGQGQRIQRHCLFS